MACAPFFRKRWCPFPCAWYGISVYRSVEYEFDPAKDAINRDKHGLPLAFGNRIFKDDDHLIIAADRPEDDEDRLKVVGLVDGKLFTAVFVLRGGRRRFISVRRSNRREERSYRNPG